MSATPSDSTELRVETIVAGTRFAGRAVYVATEDVSVASDGRAEIVERSSRLRVSPSADVLLGSAARVHQGRVAAVVLSGHTTDGAEGVRELAACGGIAIAQDPSTCVAPVMPAAAIATGAVDFMLPPDALAPALVTLAMTPGGASLFSAPGIRARARPIAGDHEQALVSTHR